MYGHRPLYCSTDDYYDCNINAPKKLRPTLEPLMHKYGVDVAAYGHLHNYERTYPVLNGSVTSKSYDKPPSTVHVVAGMAGDNEGLTPGFFKDTPAWSAVRKAVLGYVKVTVASATELQWEYISAEDGTTQDSFTLTRAAA
mmetsp:Transcript_3485/g.12698  ORF Transcript_3485/g.12698 Transcript_3485/m.12698 type:complete len:141 (+) Transcript_3485:826-1248(+)